MNGCKLSPVALGLSFGVLCGISILLIGLVATYYAHDQNFIISLGNFYPGYVPSIKGSLLSALIVFIDAFIMAFLVGWLYNRFCHCSCVCCNKEKKVVKAK